MLLPRYAVLLSISLFAVGWPRGYAQGKISFHFQNGTLGVESDMLTHLDYETDGSGLFRLEADSPTGKTKFLFFNKEGGAPLDYEKLLADIGVQVAGLETLEDVSNGVVNGWSLRRVKNEGIYFDQIIDYRIRNSPKGSAVFILVGEDDDFYTVSRSFASMAHRFQSPARRTAKSQQGLISIPEVKDSFWEVVFAILLLVANISFIWFGFRALARTRSLE